MPIILFSLGGVRRKRGAMFWTFVLVIIGLIINRFNVSMLAMNLKQGYFYFPHWMEFAISIGLVADALLVVWLAHKLLPVVTHEEPGDTTKMRSFSFHSKFRNIRFIVLPNLSLEGV
ncbi:MAG: hypothetical protein PHQ86_08255 [Dehalococcoidales bacterium]|nr:hypothetical protein [Dehalococcoidales bacterium]